MEPRISPQEAEEALAAVEQAAQQMRRLLGVGSAWAYLVLWGIIWTLGFLTSQFMPERDAIVWSVLDAIGIIASFAIGIYYGKRVRNPRLGKQFGLIWTAWLVYGALIVFVAHPKSPAETGLLVTLLVMLAYVVMGIWTQSGLLAWLGVVITAVALFGFYLLPSYANLLMALVGAGMALGGVYIRLQWR